MNPSKLYISNPQKWVSFFDRVAKTKQTGGGSIPKILPLDIVAETTKTENLPIKTVSPAEQTVQQAVSELKRENINPDSVMKVSHKSKSRRRKKTSVTKKSKVPRRGRKSKNTSGRTRIKIKNFFKKSAKRW